MMASEDLGTLALDHVEKICNTDVICLVSFVDIGLRQFARCPSATRNDVLAADVAIAAGWVSRFRQYFEEFIKEPELYMPKAAPYPLNTPTPPEIKIVQNPAIQNLLYQLAHMRTELLHCEDAERLNGFHSKQASVALLPWIEKFEAFVDLMSANIDPSNAERTWAPDHDLQEPGVNVGEPR
jgi:hypothetical protein